MQDLSNWQGCKRPAQQRRYGQFVKIEKYKGDKQLQGLWRALGEDKINERLKYFPNGPFNNMNEFGAWLRNVNVSGDFQTLVFHSLSTDNIVGMASYMRVDEKNGFHLKILISMEFKETTLKT